MNSTDDITRKIEMLSPASRDQVIALIDRLSAPPRVELTIEEKIQAWKDFGTFGVSGVIVDDSREAIYED